MTLYLVRMLTKISLLLYLYQFMCPFYMHVLIRTEVLYFCLIFYIDLKRVKELLL